MNTQDERDERDERDEQAVPAEVNLDDLHNLNGAEDAKIGAANEQLRQWLSGLGRIDVAGVKELLQEAVDKVGLIFKTAKGMEAKLRAKVVAREALEAVAARGVECVIVENGAKFFCLRNDGCLLPRDVVELGTKLARVLSPDWLMPIYVVETV